MGYVYIFHMNQLLLPYQKKLELHALEQENSIPIGLRSI